VWGSGPGAYQIVFACAAVVFFGWSMFVRFDRRPYLDVSAAGIWCRRWGRLVHASHQLASAHRQSRGSISVERVETYHLRSYAHGRRPVHFSTVVCSRPDSYDSL
jgi:hypothetical protein